ncbi:hypothetical protein [Shewanella surugensis]|uniref:Uncharacterized protein n=1 Tax=Shewanella surugensis TaxID=212020 RepID=A0ABT0LAD5_9GAMM|nr:hypothetical protein [Shewanella surugensis]MCL1124642.1 hypothetical protein [Shewanella surugensis]
MLQYQGRNEQKIALDFSSFPLVNDEKMGDGICSHYTFCTENAYFVLRVDYAGSMDDEMVTSQYSVLSVNHLGEYPAGEDGYVEEYPDVFHYEDSEIIFESDSIDELYHFLQSQTIQG